MRTAGAPAPTSGASAGRLLREAREKQGLHIAALAAAIKVVAEEARDARVRPVRRAARCDLHPRPGADRLPCPEDRPGAGDARCCRRRPATGSRQVGEGLNTPFRERPGVLGAERLARMSCPARRSGSPALLLVAAVAVFFLPAGLIGASGTCRPATAPGAAAKLEPGMPPQAGADAAGPASGRRRQRRSASASSAGRAAAGAPAGDRAPPGSPAALRRRPGEPRCRRPRPSAPATPRPPACCNCGPRRRRGSRSSTAAASRSSRACCKPAKRSASTACRRCEVRIGNAAATRAGLPRSADRSRGLHPRQRGPSRTQVANSPCATTDLRSMPDSFVEPARPAPRRSRQAQRALGRPRRHRRRRRAGARAGDDQHRHGRCDRHRDPGQGAGDRRLGDGAHHRQHARGGGRGAATSASSSTGWASTCR